MKKLYLFLSAGLFLAGASAQIQTPQPSPFTKIEQKVGLTDVTLEYSRPGMRDREIFGDLVPFGEIWRTGANENTKISFSDDVEIGGKQLKAGSYALYTRPAAQAWEVIFYTDTSNWGNPQNWDDSKVALTISADVTKLPFSMETFTILLNDLKDDQALMNIIWDRTAVTLPIKVPTEAKTMASIEKVMNGPTANDYFAAGSYYYTSHKDHPKALELVNKAIEMQGEDIPFWMLRTKSLIQADLGKKEEAIASAKLSMAAAQKAGNTDYIKLNQDSLEEWEK